MSFYAWEIPSESPEILANSMDLCNPRVVVKFWEKLAEILWKNYEIMKELVIFFRM